MNGNGLAGRWIGTVRLAERRSERMDDIVLLAGVTHKHLCMSGVAAIFVIIIWIQQMKAITCVHQSFCNNIKFGCNTNTQTKCFDHKNWPSQIIRFYKCIINKQVDWILKMQQLHSSATHTLTSNSKNRFYSQLVILTRDCSFRFGVGCTENMGGWIDKMIRWGKYSEWMESWVTQ